MREGWMYVGDGSEGKRFEIEPGVNVWDYPWYAEGGDKVQLGESATGPFLYLQVHVIHANGKRIVFAADDVYNGHYVFYLRV